MPQVNLSSLSGPELRALLNATRERGEAAQSYEILQEMAARRGGAQGRERDGLFEKRRPPEPRFIDLDPAEPLDPEDDVPPLPPNWRPTTAAAKIDPAAAAPPNRSRKRKPPATPGAPPAIEARPPIAPAEIEPLPPIAGVHFRHFATDDIPTADPQSRDLPPPREGRGAPRGFRRTLAAVFVGGLALGVPLGLWLSERVQAPQQPTPAAFRAAVQAQSPSPQPSRPSPANADPIPEVASKTVAEAPAEAEPEPHVSPGPAAGPPPSETADAAGAAPDANAPDAAAQVTARAVQADDCAIAPTPADRTICGDSQLRRLQRDPAPSLCPRPGGASEPGLAARTPARVGERPRRNLRPPSSHPPLRSAHP